MSTDASGQVDATDSTALPTLQANVARIEALSARLVAALAKRRPHAPAVEGPGQDLYLKAAQAWMGEALANPAKVIEMQAAYWGQTLTHFAQAQAALVQASLAAAAKITAPERDEPDAEPDAEPGAEPPPRKVADKRFANPLWDTDPWFHLIRDQYQTNADTILSAVAAAPDLDPKDRRRLDYFMRQIVDLMAPTNFLATNPDALEKAVATNGQSLVDGLENLVADLEANDGEMIVRLADASAFEVGGNIATTPGEVVYRNDLMELIQYRPTTGQVHKIPVVLFPPWINKFYILDLKPQNSLIKWVVDQGFTLFVASWRNPGPEMRDVALGDYVEQGFLTAMAEARRICDVKDVHAIGYCIAGTTLSLTLALMARRKEKGVRSATLFTTLTDFSDPGEVGVFLSDDFVDGIEAEVGRAGILHKSFMQRTFSYLRSNDLVYAPAIRHYMMGEPPPAFDLLFWNGDSTNLPARMAVEYLRGLCQENRFARGGFELLGHRLRLKDVTVPLCAIACETDHIAGWAQSYRGVRAMGSEDKTFILSESGHIAGIVNPPSKGKYGHWTNPDLPAEPETWRAGAQRTAGSWWPRWGAWLAERSGKMVPAREPGAGTLGPAPGSYVVAAAPRAA